jgi:hypothetical protein
MSVISKERLGWHGAESDLAETGPRALALRLRVTWTRRRLTRQLAEGADPGSSPELELRAARLTSDRERKQLVKSLRRTVRQAHERPLYRGGSIINRRAVLDAEGAINAMIARLSYAEPVRAQGMAIADRMLRNEDNSPLYDIGEPGALRHLVSEATEALEPLPEPNHEFTIAA